MLRVAFIYICSLRYYDCHIFFACSDCFFTTIFWKWCVQITKIIFWAQKMLSCNSVRSSMQLLYITMPRGRWGRVERGAGWNGGVLAMKQAIFIIFFFTIMLWTSNLNLCMKKFADITFGFCTIEKNLELTQKNIFLVILWINISLLKFAYLNLKISINSLYSSKYLIIPAFNDKDNVLFKISQIHKLTPKWGRVERGSSECYNLPQGYSTLPHPFFFHLCSVDINNKGQMSKGQRSRSENLQPG